MAASVSVKEVNGPSPGTATTITELRFCASDAYNPGNSHGILIPSSGTNRSYWKTIYLNADTTPVNQITNVVFYSDGSIDWTGCEVYIGDTATYTQATGTEDVTGDDSPVAVNSIENYTSASPYSLSGTLTNPNTGKIHDNYLVLQVDVSSSALPTSATETFTFRYNES